MRIRENERIRPIFAEMFSYRVVYNAANGKKVIVTYVGASVEAFRTVTCMEEKSLVALNEAELVPKALNLAGNNGCGDPCSFLEYKPRTV